VLAPYDAFSIIRFQHRTHNHFRSFRYHSTTFTLYFQPLPFPTHCSCKKMRPNQLPAAPCHRALRFLCQGHSLHSHRLALQRTGLILRSVSLLLHLSHAINASSRLFLPKKIRFKPASPTPAPDHPPQIFGAVGFFLPYQADSNTNHNINTPFGQL
jgi:hypothetical protein